MKKFIRYKGLISALAFSLICIPTISFFPVQATVRYDALDNLFQTTLNGILNYENTDSTCITAKKELLYDITKNELGVLYQFTYDDNEGIAILIDDGELKVTELYTAGKSPYPDDDVLKIYVSERVYCYSDGEQFYDCITGLPISEETIEILSETAYLGAIEFTYSSEQINYMYRLETPYNIQFSIPTYDYGKTNGCVPIAGTNLVAYLDKTFPNLIPDYEPGSTFLGRYRFKSGNDTIYAVSDTLYADMGTTISNGATIPQFRSGLKKYINRHGYSVDFESLISWGKLKFDRAKAVVEQGKPIALFLSGYTSATIATEEGRDVLNYETTAGNHAVAGFGCLEVSYTFSDNSTRADRYIHCAMGVGLYQNGYINVGSAKIDEALVITIS